MATDDPRVTTKTELMKSQLNEQVKQHIVFDNLDRPVLVFTASLDTKDGEPCSVTEYVYRGPASTQVLDRQERVYSWKSAWESLYTFDPSANYDPDGDGNL